jgi:hypothetical protein
VREVDDPEAVRELDDGVPAESDKSPEHERVRHAHHRPFADGLALKQHVQDEALDAEPGLVERKRAGTGGNEAETGRHLRRESANEQQEQ